MKLERVVDFISNLPRTAMNFDETQAMCMCPECDHEGTSKPHLSIKLEVKENEPMVYMCFRASCGIKGVVDTAMLRKLGCIDPDTIRELAEHNAHVDPHIEKDFVERESRDVAMVNLPSGNSKAKMQYIQQRLGVKLTYEQLKDLKIQLSLLDMLRLNDIKKLSVKSGYAKNLDVFCIGFISMFRDYMICRDITPDNKLGMRYFNYRISGKADKNDLRIYSIPREIDIMDPKSAIINVAEGPFSILGAYLNTDLGAEHRNSVWLANCGAQFDRTIMTVCKQYGLLKVRINIWSDSEIKIEFYRKLYHRLRNRLDIRRFTVYYNDKAEDFGHPKRDIRIRAVTLYGKESTLG